jgi:hypothetical protein
MQEHTWSRRQFLQRTGVGLASCGLTGLLGCSSQSDQNGLESDGDVRPVYLLSPEERFTGRCVEVAKPAFGLPGRWPGKVVEVHHPASVINGRVQLEAVQQMVSPRHANPDRKPTTRFSAWKTLFQKGDRVGHQGQPCRPDRWQKAKRDLPVSSWSRL